MPAVLEGELKLLCTYDPRQHLLEGNIPVQCQQDGSCMVRNPFTGDSQPVWPKVHAPLWHLHSPRILCRGRWCWGGLQQCRG